MIYRILVFLTLISQLACGQQTQPSKKSNPFSFIDSIFTKPGYNVEILDFVFPQDVQEVLLRFQKSMAENKEWAEEYFSKNYKAGEGLPYHENLGITKEEYQKIKDIEKSPPKVVVKSIASLKRNRTSDFLSFSTAEDGISFIELLRIDLKNEQLVFNEDTIPFHNEITASASTPFGEWHGYSWKKEISNLGETDDLKVDSLVSKIVEISFGIVKANNKILFRLKYKDVNRGELKANVDIACFLN